jgi:putative FmdB family regulatory protein
LEVKGFMPIYEYHCQVCGHTFEVLQKFSDKPIEECPRCSSAVERLLSPPALVFKGGGWYVNEFPSKDRKKGLDTDKGNGEGTPRKGGSEKQPLAGEESKSK